MAVTTGYFIIEGWVSRGEMYVSGSKIVDFAIQADQISGRRWLRPGNTADVVAPARLVDTPLGSRVAYGGLIFTWPMVNLSPNMVKFLQETYFSPVSSPASFFQRTWSNQLTVQTFNRASGDWETYQTYGRFANFAGEATPVAGGYTDLQIQHTAFKEAPLGPDTGPQVTPVGTPSNGADFTYNTTVTNGGDASTFGTTTLTMTIPPTADFVSTSTAVTSALTYSEDGGVTYSGTLPSPLSDTTHVRYTLTDPLVVSEVSGNFEFIVNPNAVGSMAAVFVGTTQGDEDLTNDSVTSTLTVLAFDPDIFAPVMNLDAQADAYETFGTTTLAVNNDPVDRWNDQTANNEDVDQSVLANRPIFKTGQANSLNAILFDGSSEWFDSILSTASLTTGDMTAFLVLDPTSAAAGQEFLFVSDTSPSIMAQKANTGSNDNVGFFFNGGATGWEIFGGATAALQLLTFKVSGTNISAYRDGTLLSTEAGGTASFGGGFTLGADAAGAQYHYGGLLYEVYMFNTALSDLNRGLVEAFLIAKYAIP